jgi:hypothetical protein
VCVICLSDLVCYHIQPKLLQLFLMTTALYIGNARLIVYIYDLLFGFIPVSLRYNMTC